MWDTSGSHYTSASASAEAIAAIDRGDDNPDQTFNQLTRRLNICSGAAFVGGAVLALVFMMGNL